MLHVRRLGLFPSECRQHVRLDEADLDNANPAESVKGWKWDTHCRGSVSVSVYLNEYRDNTHHRQQLPHRLTRLGTDTEPILRPRRVEHDVLDLDRLLRQRRERVGLREGRVCSQHFHRLAVPCLSVGDVVVKRISIFLLLLQLNTGML